MSNLSDIFKYISCFRHAGHQVGRKVGDMLEILTFSALLNDPNIRKRLQIEPKLYGYSGAGHKVEFAINRVVNPNHDIINGGIILEPEQLIGFVECKKVGVEQTVNSTFKKSFKKYNNKYFKIPYNVPFLVKFNSKKNKRNYSYSVTLTKNSITVANNQLNEPIILEEKITPNHRIIFTLSDSGESDVLGNSASLRNIQYTLNNCRILELIESRSDCIVGILNDCLAGPQTPEKAKQSSFVALDVRKKRFGSFDKRLNEKECISVLVLTEYVHWEIKSQSMIKSCLDKNFVIDDSLIIEAFEMFEAEFGSIFYDKITKTNYFKNAAIKKIADSLIAKHEARIFRDIEDNSLYKIIMKDEALHFA